ncbi:MAG: carbon monoxide dehydrogenase subunit G [Acidobacteriota bacterium]
MKIEGTHLISAPRQKVWNFLIDPHVIAKSIPGCEKMEPLGDDNYEASLKFGIGAIKGTFTSRVRVSDQEPPSQYRLAIQGNGALGFVRGEGAIRLEDAGLNTNVLYSGEVQIGGLIASVGQRMVQGFAKQTISHFFDSIARQVEDSPHDAPLPNL